MGEPHAQKPCRDQRGLDTVSLGSSLARQGAGAAATAFFPPCMKAGNHVVCESTDMWTSKEVIAHAPRKRGIPTLGFTTSQIFAWFIAPSLHPRRVDVRERVRETRDQEEDPRSVDHVFV
jgi:hypothetical protein